VGGTDFAAVKFTSCMKNIKDASEGIGDTKN
jgi:hypothetical protein